MKNNTWLKIRNVKFNNPIITASGTFGFGAEFKKFLTLKNLGGIVTKGITLKPRTGNTGERIFETPSGLMNSIGLENPGVDLFIKEILPDMLKYKTNVIVNIAGHSIGDYEKLIKKLDSKKISGFEVNVSCPNLKKGGEIFGRETKVVVKLCKRLRKLTKKLMIFKLSPNALDIVEQSTELEKAGADVLTIANSYTGLVLNKSRKPFFNKTFAGLSGPAIKPLTLRLVWLVSDAVKIPVIGSGGIMKFDDVLDYLAAGASLIQVGTVNFIKPGIAGEFVSQLNKLRKNKRNFMKTIIGSAKK
ncbi:dihydroorotate dehydrogenase [Candidatus Dependentiae bacterium]|nr:dihydroorotate dehydrogenase [Candidatus Dependentiae bacterium]